MQKYTLIHLEIGVIPSFPKHISCGFRPLIWFKNIYFLATASEPEMLDGQSKALKIHIIA